MPLTWLLMRASGIVALVVLTLSVVLGLVGPTLRPSTRLATITVHRASAAVGTVLIALHVVLAVLDEFVDVPLIAVVVPGSSPWQRVGIALGAVAVDLLLAVVITATLRTRLGHSWRRVHLLAYGVWTAVVAHALLVGTDTDLVRWTCLGSVVIVLAAASVRLLRRPATSSAEAARAREADLTGASG